MQILTSLAQEHVSRSVINRVRMHQNAMRAITAKANATEQHSGKCWQPAPVVGVMTKPCRAMHAEARQVSNGEMHSHVRKEIS